MLVANNGGHLLQLCSLMNVWEKYESFWVTGNKPDASSLLGNEKIYYGYTPTDRNIVNLFRNIFLAVKIIFKEKPDVIVSTGAALAVPFCYVGKIFGCKVIYLESFAKINTPTLSGKMVYPISNLFLIQWESMRKHYPKAKYAGTVYDDILDSGAA